MKRKKKRILSVSKKKIEKNVSIPLDTHFAFTGSYFAPKTYEHVTPSVVNRAGVAPEVETIS